MSDTKKAITESEDFDKDSLAKLSEHKTFDLGLKSQKSKGGGTLQTLSSVQAAFKDNAQNITLNLAKLESAGAFDRGATIIATTSGVYVAWIDKESLMKFTQAQNLGITIPGGDRRNATYNIDTNS